MTRLQTEFEKIRCQDAHYKKNKTKITQHGVTNCFKNLISLGHTEERQQSMINSIQLISQINEHEETFVQLGTAKCK